CPSQVSASSTGAALASAAARASDLGVRGGAAALPTRATSSASPRSLLRWLQVRFSIAIDWFRHAGHEQEYTPPVFFSSYGFDAEPCIMNVSPSARSGMLRPPLD